MCKRSDTFSLRVLIGRGLDLLPNFLSLWEYILFTSLRLFQFWGFSSIVGVYYSEDPPVPIPNTVVKLVCAEDTWRAASRKNRSMPTQRSLRLRCSSYSSLAQSVEHAAVNRRVVGSSPTGGAKQKSVHVSGRIFVCIIHFSIFIIHYSLNENGFSNE